MEEKYDLLTEENFLIYCVKYYNNSSYVNTDEFIEDINRLKYIKKLITRYIENGDLKERLILNHIIILSNCFPAYVLSKIMYLKFKNNMKYLKPFLILINVLPDKIYNVGDEQIVYTDTIDMDMKIIQRLRMI
jgi:hypothetical protein